jgi:uncharacterized protein (TIGR00297 family)
VAEAYDMSPDPRSDTMRKLVHVAMAGFALLLRWIPWWMAALLAAGAVASNLTWIPGVAGGRLMREEEQGRRWGSGVVLYALSVLVLILVFRDRLDLVAGAWGILAFGDGAATLVGRNAGGPRLPWNRAKSWSGTLAFFLFGTAGSAALMSWVRAGAPSPPGELPVVAIAAAAALATGVVESLSLELNDNVSVPLLSVLVLYSLSLVDPEIWRSSAALLLGNLGRGVVVTAAFALAAWWTGSVSGSGVAAGLLVGVVIAVFTGLAGFGVLGVFFVLGAVTTRLGYRWKAARGIAQEKGGARGAVHALANCAVPAYLAFLAASVPEPLASALKVAFVASLATAACDTLGSEVGPLGGRDPFLVTRLRRVPAGTPGAVSMLGTLAGAGGALLVGAAGAVGGLIAPAAVGIVVAAALTGAFLESFLAATLEPGGWIGSETINFINTLAGGLAAVGLTRLAEGWR